MIMDEIMISPENIEYPITSPLKGKIENKILERDIEIYTLAKIAILRVAPSKKTVAGFSIRHKSILFIKNESKLYNDIPVTKFIKNINNAKRNWSSG